ncbi:von Willebrand factor A domain-containing protein 3B [Gracilinanus agilis]|uniref:von Willebrand factor A domain-containing protein 3B n=1 Tax=Gracilinanus agilis TaxID=191870 RepID=UPI001CFE7D00|nr:von Willebrand factor A domain-containing protein 3B [Gracilinanus agilis]
MTRNLPGRLVWNENEYHEEIVVDAPNQNSETELVKFLTLTNHDRPSSKSEASSNTQGQLDWYNLISSEEWLRIHGLKTKKLTLSHILSQIGFPHQEDYVCSIGKIVASRYADGLFRQFCKAEDGTIYRVTAKTELIYPYVIYLNDAVECFKERMNWLTSGSRQIFGVILEQCITIVLDFGSLDEEEFSLCQDALVMVIDEQVAQLTKFNLIQYDASSSRGASWMDIGAGSQRSRYSLLTVCLRAGFYFFVSVSSLVVAIYYFLVGNVLEDSKKSLLHSATESSHPIHTVSFNAQGEDTIIFLKKLSSSSKGRFHAFAARIVPLGIPEPSSKNGTLYFSSNLRKLKGRVPPGAGVREDVYLIWRELEEARNTLSQIQKIIEKSTKAPHLKPGSDISSEKESTSVESFQIAISKGYQRYIEELEDTTKEKSEEFDPSSMTSLEDRLDSKKWLQKYGLKAQKLTAFDILADCSFRHIDGVVDIKAKPDNVYLQTCAEPNKKNVHAKYCNKFVHTPWKDGRMVHVYVTADKCKAYEEKMYNALEQINKRIEWLQNGSQGLFGMVLEDFIYILIDTSQSMKGKLPLVKEKIFQLLKEQLIFKKKFNFVKFDAKAVPWQKELAEVNEDNLEKAKEWIKNLQVGSSTNTMDALKIAFSDKGTKIIYILTDGRPDQSAETILRQIQLRKKIPIHTISFNYHDEDANEFLKELSLRTGGEFHYFHYGFRDPLDPDAYMNQQMNLLQQEVEMGQNDLERVQNLCTESMMLDWYQNLQNEEETEHKKPNSEVVLEKENLTEITLETPPKRKVCPSETSSISPCGSPPQILKKKIPFAEPTKTSLLRNSFIEKKLKEKGWNAKKDLPEPKEFSGKRTISPNRKEVSVTGEKIPQVRSRDSSQDSLDMSSESWLKINGLAAKRLTIMDVLSSSTIPHRSKYVPVLGKHVGSKVYDSVLTLKHVGNGSKQMILINPLSVNFKTYIQNVEQAVKSFKRRLNLLIWKAFSAKERKKLKLQEPVQYLEDKEAIQKALEEANLSISFEDMLLLENEIEAGNTYIKQAMEIQEASKKENPRGDQLLEKTHGQGKKFKNKRIDPLKGQKVIARSEENGFYFPGTVIRCIGPTHALVQFKYGETRVVPIVFITPVGGAMPCPTLQVGDYVFAKILIPKGCHFYVPAIIIATPNREEPSDKFYTVLKCNNRRDFCLRSGLIKISQNKYALSCSFIRTTPMKEPPKMDAEEMRSDFMVFPFDEETETGLLRDSEDETSKKSKSRKKSETKKQPQDIFSSDSEDSIFGYDTSIYCSKPRDQAKKEWFSDNVSKEDDNKYSKYYAQWVNTYPKCQCYSKTLNIKKQFF